MELLECFMRQSTCYSGSTCGKPVGVLWHDTGAGNPELRRYVQPDDNAPDKAALLAKLGKNGYGNDWNHSSLQVGVNAFVGKLANGSVAAVQVLPWTLRPWGCGSGRYGSCNGSGKDSPFWIQFEICDDGYRSAEYFQRVYRQAVELTAYLCRRFGIDPTGTVQYHGVNAPTILCHADAHRLGLGSNHGDVLTWLSSMGKTMQNVRSDVREELEGGAEMRYQTLKELKQDKYKSPYYLPTVEKLMQKGILKGKSGAGDNTVLDLGEDAVRLLVILDRAGIFR